MNHPTVIMVFVNPGPLEITIMGGIIYGHLHTFIPFSFYHSVPALPSGHTIYDISKKSLNVSKMANF